MIPEFILRLTSSITRYSVLTHLDMLQWIPIIGCFYQFLIKSSLISWLRLQTIIPEFKIRPWYWRWTLLVSRWYISSVTTYDWITIKSVLGATCARKLTYDYPIVYYEQIHRRLVGFQGLFSFGIRCRRSRLLTVTIVRSSFLESFLTLYLQQTREVLLPDLYHQQVTTVLRVSTPQKWEYFSFYSRSWVLLGYDPVLKTNTPTFCLSEFTTTKLHCHESLSSSPMTLPLTHHSPLTNHSHTHS